ncbi:hypothetical protein Q6325_30220, partial [Klebsiella pneumoniae]|uniref:hypothetical protein n=1 Tax=Klebsiella pneumoniae TaxID=573 RepID=UPI002730BBEA
IGMALPASATSAAPAATVVDPRRPLRILGIEMPPFTMATAYGVTGMLPEMCQLLFERLKQPLQFDVVPWARAVLMLKT